MNKKIHILNLSFKSFIKIFNTHIYIDIELHIEHWPRKKNTFTSKQRVSGSLVNINILTESTYKLILISVIIIYSGWWLRRQNKLTMKDC